MAAAEHRHRPTACNQAISLGTRDENGAEQDYIICIHLNANSVFHIYVQMCIITNGINAFLVWTS